MKKKEVFKGILILSFIIATMFYVTISGMQTPTHAASMPVVSPQKLEIDTVQSQIQSYLIDGANYYKLRDLAMILKGKEKNFSIAYDRATASIKIEMGKDYTPTGSELQPLSTKIDQFSKSDDMLLYNGASLNLNAYKINGNNYYKLREICALADVGVGYNAQKKQISLDTSKGYAELEMTQLKDTFHTTMKADTYTNGAYGGYSVQVPAVLLSMPSTFDGCGLILNRDKNAEFIIHAENHLNDDFNFKSYIENLAKEKRMKYDESVSLSYTKHQEKFDAAGIHSLSGNNDGEEIYIVYKKDPTFKNVLFTIKSRISNVNSVNQAFLEVHPLLYELAVNSLEISGDFTKKDAANPSDNPNSLKALYQEYKKTGKIDYVGYRNERFEFDVEIPKIFKDVPESGNGDGVPLYEDDVFTLSVYASHNVMSENLQGYIDEILSYPDNMEYRNNETRNLSSKKGMVYLSMLNKNTNDRKHYYLTEDGGIVYHIYLRIKNTQKADAQIKEILETIVDHMVQTLKI